MVLFTHRWGGDCDDPFPMVLGPALAARGITTLSYRLRRHGLDGQLRVLPDDDVDDLQHAVRFLAEAEHSKLVLCGQGVGALSVGRYLVKDGGANVRGIACVSPAHPMGESLARMISQETYQEARATAERAVSQGNGHDQVIELALGGRIGIRQQAAVWLRWWAGSADTDLSQVLRDVTVPILICGADEPWAATLRSNLVASTDLRMDPTGENQTAAAHIASWIEEICA